jgi:CheY-like chemotaxis protein
MPDRAYFADHELFLAELRQALEDLHDPDRLAQSHLVARLGLTGHKFPYDALQRLLTEAIAGLEPQPDVPVNSRAWRIYDLLSCRYIQELSVPAVAHQLGMSVRHLRREQQAAIAALAFRLEEQHAAMEAPEKPAAGLSDARAANPLLADLAWLKAVPLTQPTDLGPALTAVIALAQPLATKYGVAIEPIPAAPLPGLAVHPVVLDQILLNLLTVALRRAAGGRVQLRVTPGRWAVAVDLRSPGGLPSRPLSSPEDAASLHLAQELVTLCGGRLVVRDGRAGFGAAVSLPTFERLPVLVIDDNADTLRLLERFAAGTRYRVFSADDPAQALSLAQAVKPQVIVLDVMMPAIDGWRVLGQLRQHPFTAQLPILVCTILAQEELARSLGATDFLRKPITQEAFLAALDREAARLVPEPATLPE